MTLVLALLTMVPAPAADAAPHGGAPLLAAPAEGLVVEPFLGQAHGVATTADGGFVVVGATMEVAFEGWESLLLPVDGFVARYGPTGEKAWLRTIDLGGREAFWDVGVDRDGDLFLSGHGSLPGGGSHGVVVRMAGDGAVRWVQGHGHSGSVATLFRGLVVEEGAVAVVGEARFLEDGLVVPYPLLARFGADGRVLSSWHDATAPHRRWVDVTQREEPGTYYAAGRLGELRGDLAQVGPKGAEWRQVRPDGRWNAVVDLGPGNGLVAVGTTMPRTPFPSLYSAVARFAPGGAQDWIRELDPREPMARFEATAARLDAAGTLHVAARDATLRTAWDASPEGSLRLTAGLASGSRVLTLRYDLEGTLLESRERSLPGLDLVPSALALWGDRQVLVAGFVADARGLSASPMVLWHPHGGPGA